MEEKTRKLLLVLELVALLTAAVLILVDYKLKRDLVDLTKNVENAIGQARQLYSPEAANTDSGSNHDSVRIGDLVGTDSRMETGLDTETASPNGHTKTVQRARATSKRNGGNRNSSVPQSDNEVGS